MAVGMIRLWKHRDTAVHWTGGFISNADSLPSYVTMIANGAGGVRAILLRSITEVVRQTEALYAGAESRPELVIWIDDDSLGKGLCEQVVKYLSGEVKPRGRVKAHVEDAVAALRSYQSEANVKIYAFSSDNVGMLERAYSVDARRLSDYLELVSQATTMRHSPNYYAQRKQDLQLEKEVRISWMIVEGSANMTAKRLQDENDQEALASEAEDEWAYLVANR